MHRAKLNFDSLALENVVHVIHWVATVLLVALPTIVAVDYAGVMPWTHYIVSIVALVVIALASLVAVKAPAESFWRIYGVLVPLLIWIVFAMIQIVPLPVSVERMLSPASASAYTDWIDPFLPQSERPSWIPISISRFNSQHAIAIFAVVVGCIWAALTLLRDRSKVVVVLAGTAFGVTLIAAAGLWVLAFPESNLWSASNRSSFGPFINRNNASLFLNLGLGASLGLLAWRLTALSGHEIDDPTFELNDLFALTHDRDSMIGIVGCVVATAGLLVCGSRGGLIAACFGLLMAFGWVRQRRGLVSIPVVGSVIAISLVLLIVPLNLDLESVRRLEVFSQQDTTTILRNGRLNHWRDGMAAAVAHLPAGAGMSTYEFAYLPFQEHASDSWARHADNLWLELFTEQGVFGAILAIAVIVFCLRALSRLSDSPDPIDHGLRVTGWHCLAVIMVSQIFDFGLIIPANLLLTVVLFSAIVARSSMVSGGTEFAATRPVFFVHRRAGYIALPCISILFVLFAISSLRRDAEIDGLVRTSRFILDRNQASPAVLAKYIRRLEDLSHDAPTPALLQTMMWMELRRARLEEAFAAQPKNEAEFVMRYRASSPREKRLRWFAHLQQSDTSELPGGAEEAISYDRALKFARRCLLSAPLDVQARVAILFLEHRHHDHDQSEAAIRQLAKLYRNQPGNIVTLGQFAADGGDISLAAKLWKWALQENVGRTGEIFKLCKLHRVSVAEVLPDNPEHYRRIAPYLLSDPESYADLLRTSLKKLACIECPTRSERAECASLAGDIARSIGEAENAFEQYQEAIRWRPLDPELRLKYIRCLREHGRRDEALKQARRARAAFPADERFSKLIESMAEADLKQLLNQESNR